MLQQIGGIAGIAKPRAVAYKRAVATSAMPVRPFKAAVAGACASLLLFGQPVSAAGIGSSGLLPQGMETPSTVVDVTKSKLGAADEVRGVRGRSKRGAGTQHPRTQSPWEGVHPA